MVIDLVNLVNLIQTANYSGMFRGNFAGSSLVLRLFPRGRWPAADLTTDSERYAIVLRAVTTRSPDLSASNASDGVVILA